MPPKNKHDLQLTLLVGLWLGVVGATAFALADYQGTAGRGASAPARWPHDSALPLDSEKWTLLVVIHPRCSCSRASLSELDRLMSRVGETVQARALFVVPNGVDASWRMGDLWDSASRIPNLTVFSDEGGREAERFGAYTSGQVLLYQSTGMLRYAGGLTSARGHEGESVGASSIRDLVGSRSTSAPDTHVYGCSLGTEPTNGGDSQ